MFVPALDDPGQGCYGYSHFLSFQIAGLHGAPPFLPGPPGRAQEPRGLVRRLRGVVHGKLKVMHGKLTGAYGKLEVVHGPRGVVHGKLGVARGKPDPVRLPRGVERGRRGVVRRLHKVARGPHGVERERREGARQRPAVRPRLVNGACLAPTPLRLVRHGVCLLPGALSGPQPLARRNWHAGDLVRIEFINCIPMSSPLLDNFFRRA